jgi:hypothetical protein
MTEWLVDQLLSLPDIAAQKQFLRSHVSELDDGVAAALKEQADLLIRSNLGHTLQVSELMLYLAELSGKPAVPANDPNLGAGCVEVP